MAPAADAMPPAFPPGAPAFCARPGDDAIRDLFCAEPRPSVAGLADLHSLLRIRTDVYGNGQYKGLPPSLAAHSTSLSGHVVSSLNPRVIVVGENFEFFVAFQRGVQQVELAARRRDIPSLAFYLLSFRQACNDGAEGCRPGHLYTPYVESGWTSVAIRDDEDLKNTPSDCRQCHQRGTDKPSFLMRELHSPWTHFFSPEGDLRSPIYRFGINGGMLTTEYRVAKGEEAYGSLTSYIIQNTFGGSLELMVDQEQALVFDAPSIMGERYPSGDDWPKTVQRSATWDAEYAAFKRGDHLPLPYFDAHATDATKLSSLTAAYQSYRNGTSGWEDLPDLSDIFPDDPQTRAEIGLETEPDATAAEALVQACGTCHNDVLDQSISRARFSVDVTRLDRTEIERAIERLSLPDGVAGAMPPHEARQLAPAVRQRVVDFLRQGDFSDEDRSFLAHAASAGMAGIAKVQVEVPVTSPPRDYDAGSRP
jgi:hypothetical protein